MTNATVSDTKVVNDRDRSKNSLHLMTCGRDRVIRHPATMIWMSDMSGALRAKPRS